MEEHKKSYKHNGFEKSRATWYEEFELLNGYYSISDIQYYFEHYIKKHEKLTNKAPA